MAFPFPPNPVDGQQVSHNQPDGSVLSATYNASKNEWVVSRQVQSTTVVSGPAINVTPTADRQVITWDANANTWVASTVHPPKLTELADVIHSDSPHLNSTVMWTYVAGQTASQGRWTFGTQPAHIKNWDSTVHWESGAAVYYHGQLWRATRDSSNVEPAVEEGRTQLYIHVAGEPTFGILPTDITTAAPPTGTQRMGFRLGYWLQYTDDHHMAVWKFVTKGLDPTDHHPIGEWEGRPWTCMVWRNPNPPSAPVPPGTVVVWIRCDPTSTVHPVKGQQDWASLELNSYLSQSADVEQGVPADGDILTYSAANHKWVRITRAQLAASLGIPPTNP